MDMRAFALGFLALCAACTNAPPPHITVATNLSASGNIDYFFGPMPEAIAQGIHAELPDAQVTLDSRSNQFKPELGKTILEEQAARGFDVYVSGSGTISGAIMDGVAATGKPHFVVAYEPGIVDGPNRLRLLPSYRSEAAVWIEAVRRSGAKRVAALVVKTNGTVAQFERIIAPALRADGVEFTHEVFEWSGTDYAALVARAAAKRPDMLLVSAYYDAQLVPILDEIERQELTRMPMVLSLHAAGLLQDDAGRKRLRPYRFICPEFDARASASKAESWAANWRKAHGKDPFYSAAYAYDTGRLIGRALAAGGPVTHASLLAAQPFEGVTGRIAMTAGGDLIGTLGICRVEPDLRTVMER